MTLCCTPDYNARLGLHVVTPLNLVEQHCKVHAFHSAQESDRAMALDGTMPCLHRQISLRVVEAHPGLVRA